MHTVHVDHPVKRNERRFDDSNILLVVSTFSGVGIGSLQCGLSQPLYNNPSPDLKLRIFPHRGLVQQFFYRLCRYLVF